MDTIVMVIAVIVYISTLTSLRCLSFCIVNCSTYCTFGGRYDGGKCRFPVKMMHVILMLKLHDERFSEFPI